MKPSCKVGQGKRRYDRAFSDTRLVPDISNWPSSLSNSSSDQLTLSPPSPGDSENSSPDHWDITLDRDLYETIICLYPEWFGQHMAQEIPREDMNMNSPGSPRSVVDEASIQKAMERNKESLKVKLLLRRPISQLVEQGILPRKFFTRFLSQIHFDLNLQLLKLRQSFTSRVRNLNVQEWKTF